MNLRQLRYFVTIVDWGSLSKAALKLHIAQPALTQQIAQLEARLKAQLLTRSPQGVSATPAGERLYRHARNILRYAEEAERDVAEETQVAGAVSIGLPTSVAMILAVPLVSRVRQDYPGIYLTVFESLSGYLDELLARHRLDLAVLFRDTPQNGISVEPLLCEQLFVISRGDQPADDTISIAAAARLALVLPSPAQTMRVLIEASFAQQGLTTNVIADVDSLPTLRRLAESGFAATIVPMSALSGLDTRQLRVQQLVEPGITRVLSLCRATGLPETVASAAVATIVRAEIRRLVVEGKWRGVNLLPA